MAHFEDDDAYPVTRITAGALGEPGQRVFILQAHYGEQVVSWVVEKSQVVGLGRGLPQLLESVHAEFPELGEPLIAAGAAGQLKEPLMPEFRVGSIDLDYDRFHDLIVITLVDAGSDEFEDLDAPQQSAELILYATRGQATLLARQADEIVSAGRPLCPACGEPLDDFGHFCLPASLRRARDVSIH